MVAFVFLLLVLLVSCGGDDSRETSPLIIHSGYSYALVGNDMYIPEFWDDMNSSDARTVPIGELVVAYYRGEGTLEPDELSTDHKHIVMYLDFVIGDVAENCRALSGNENAVACATYNIGEDETHCTIYIEEDYPAHLWGHEFWHCVAGDFH